MTLLFDRTMEQQAGSESYLLAYLPCLGVSLVAKEDGLVLGADLFTSLFSDSLWSSTAQKM